MDGRITNKKYCEFDYKKLSFNLCALNCCCCHSLSIIELSNSMCALNATLIMPLATVKWLLHMASRECDQRDIDHLKSIFYFPFNIINLIVPLIIKCTRITHSAWFHSMRKQLIFQNEYLKWHFKLWQTNENKNKIELPRANYFWLHLPLNANSWICNKT